MSVGPVVGDAIATGLFVFISSIWEEVCHSSNPTGSLHCERLLNTVAVEVPVLSM